MLDNKNTSSATYKPLLSPGAAQKLSEEARKNPTAFWAEQAQNFLSWFAPWTKVQQGSFETLDLKWFIEGKLNACFNCVDRHLSQWKNKTAIFWEGNDPKEKQELSYGTLFEKVSLFGNVLKGQGIKKGDRVGIYLPLIPEAIICMLACARIGAIHSVVFSGFSSEALKERLLHADCSLLITADEGFRADKIIPLKKNADKALKACANIHSVIVVKRSGNLIPWQKGRDHWYHELMAKADSTCPPVWMDSADPLFILYTSGSTGKPKGVVHSTGGYMVYVAFSYHFVFNPKPEEVYWCTADLGWITGHSYGVYGPLSQGSTLLLFEGVPQYPSFSRYWELIDNYQVNTFYTSPTALRSLRQQGDSWLKTSTRKSLKLLGTVGEPISPTVFEWYYQMVGQARCPIIDTWWQTETGGILISPLPGISPLLPGAACSPLFGIEASILDENGNPLTRGKEGKLVIKTPWPGLMQAIYKDAQTFAAYFKAYPGSYLTGDLTNQDEKGYFWIRGRNDDVIKVSGHRFGSEELESALLSHPAISEAAVVGSPDSLTGESLYAYLVPKTGIKPDATLNQALAQILLQKIGPIAKLQHFHWTAAIPKTRSGKIVRRILRQIAANQIRGFGDLSTLTEPKIIEDLIQEKLALIAKPHSS